MNLKSRAARGAVFVAVFGALLSAASGVEAILRDDTPPHIEEACVAVGFSHFIEVDNYRNMPGGGVIIMPEFIRVDGCIKTEPRCVWGNDYDGPKVCAEVQP